MPPPPVGVHTLTTIEACVALGVTRHGLRALEVAGVLPRAGTVARLGAHSVVYAASDVDAAPARLAALKASKAAARRPANVPRPAPPTIPADMMTAAEACVALDITNHTLGDWQRLGRLSPALRQMDGKGAMIRLFLRSEVAAAERARDYRAPNQRISAVADEVTAGASIAEAIHRACVSRTTWNYWVRHRKDAAAVAGAVRASADEAGEAEAREVMARVLARFEQGAPIREALMSEGLGPTDHQKWIAGTARTPYASRWFAAEYTKIRMARGKADAARRAQEKAARADRWAGQVGLVYFVSGPGKTDAVKIGWASKSVADRVAGLQVGSPVELRALAAVGAFAAFERWCHREFADDRMYGEWFKRTPRLMSFIDRLRDVGDVTSLTPTELRAMLASPALSLFGGNHGPTP